MTTEIIVWEDWKASELKFKLTMAGYNVNDISNEKILLIQGQVNNACNTVAIIISNVCEEIVEVVNTLTELLTPVIDSLVENVKGLINTLSDCYSEDELEFIDNIERKFRHIRHNEYVKQERYYDDCFKIIKTNYNSKHNKIC